MAWTPATSPHAGQALDGAWYGGAGRWLLSTNGTSSLYATSDFATYTASTRPSSALGPIVVRDACTDGSRWYIVGDNGLAWSTDGLTAAAWEVSPLTTLYQAGGNRGARVIGCNLATGTLVVVDSTGRFSSSADAGASWTYHGQMTSPSTNQLTWSVTHTGTHWLVTCGSSTMFVSDDDAATWSAVGIGSRMGPAGALPGGAMVAWQVGTQVRISFNNGVNWLLAGYTNGANAPQFVTTPDALYHWDATAAELWSTVDPGGARAAVDMTGAPSPVGKFGAGDRLVFTKATNGVPPYLADAVNTPSVITLPISLEVVAPPVVSLPISLEVIDGSSVVSLPIVLAVVDPAVLSLPISIEVFDAATVGGLDGAGGWPAVPGGRWQPVVVLAGADISARLAGQLTVTQADNEASIAEFSFKPTAPMLPMGLIGQPVRIAVAQWTATGPINAHTLFSGVIETPSIDLATGLITCLCHDQLQEIASNTSRDWIDTEVGGRWREEVSGIAADNWDYLQERIASVPKTYALDALQRLRVIPWRGAGLTAATIRQADILDGSISIDLPSRSQIRTRITCRLQYRYERLRGRGALAAYSQPLRFYIGDFRAAAIGGPYYGVKWLTTAMVDSALSGLSGWTMAGAATLDQPAAGAYLLGDVVGDGQYLISAAVAPDLVMGFTGRLQARWRQTVTEDYTVTLTLPAVEADTGPIGEEIGATLDAPFELTEWGTDPDVLPALSVPTVGDVATAWQPTGADTAARDEVMRTLLDRAWVRLYDSTRSGRVRFALPMRPDLWLDWSPTLEFTALRASGKVAEITHTMDLDTGTATTEAAIAVGLPGAADASLPTWTLPTVTMPDETRPLTAYACEIGTYVGGADATTPRPPEAGGGASPPFDADTMIGFVTNLDLAFEGAAFNWYPHQLSVRAPTIAAIDRDPLELPAVATIEATIPTDLLEIL